MFIKVSKIRNCFNFCMLIYQSIKPEILGKFKPFSTFELLFIRTKRSSANGCSAMSCSKPLCSFLFLFIYFNSDNAKTCLPLQKLFVVRGLQKKQGYKNIMYQMWRCRTWGIGVTVELLLVVLPNLSARTAFFTESGIGTPNFCALSLALSSALRDPSLTTFFSSLLVSDSSILPELSFWLLSCKMVVVAGVGEVTAGETFLFKIIFLGATATSSFAFAVVLEYLIFGFRFIQEIEMEDNLLFNRNFGSS